MNRIDRLTAMIIYLQGRRFTSVRELSERYGISERTVYRDLTALQEAGIPLGSEPEKGYYIVRGYHLPPVMFNREEATSLLAAERLMQKWEQSELSSSFKTALDKIRAILPHPDKEYFEKLEQHIIHYPGYETQQPQQDMSYFRLLQEAVIEHEIVEITYHSFYSQAKTRRKVEPLGLLVFENYWYLAGWCQKRSDYRTFRLDRIKECASTGIEFTAEHSLKEYYETTLGREKKLEEVVIWFDKEVIRYLGNQKYKQGWAWEKEVGDGVEITFLNDHSEYFSRWLLIWGNGIKIIKPDHIRQKVEELTAELYHHHLSKKEYQQS